MKFQHWLLAGVLILGLGLLSFRVTYSFFSNSANSTGNVFTAAEQFPTASPSATPTPSPTSQAGDVVINEINWAGSASSSADEWVELRNTTGNSIDLSNWAIDGLGASASAVVIPSGKSISGNGLFLISNFDQNSSSSNLNVAPDYVTASVSLSNTSELLVLKTSTVSGTTIDSAGHNGGSWFAGVSTTPHKSMERNSAPGDGTVAGSWHTASSSANLDPGASESATPRAVND